MMGEGTPLEFISKAKLEDKTFEDKLALILDEVRDGKILVLEESLSPKEKRVLIEQSLEEVDDEFPGIEFSSLESSDIFDRVADRVMSAIGRERRSGLTIVGNSTVMETVKEDRDSVSLLAKSAEAEE